MQLFAASKRRTPNDSQQSRAKRGEGGWAHHRGAESGARDGSAAWFDKRGPPRSCIMHSKPATKTLSKKPRVSRRGAPRALYKKSTQKAGPWPVRSLVSPQGETQGSELLCEGRREGYLVSGWPRTAPPSLRPAGSHQADNQRYEQGWLAASPPPGGEASRSEASKTPPQPGAGISADESPGGG